MDFASIAGLGLGLLGSRSSSKAAEQAAAAQLEAAKIAADAAAFKPYSVTTGPDRDWETKSIIYSS